MKAFQLSNFHFVIRGLKINFYLFLLCLHTYNQDIDILTPVDKKYVIEKKSIFIGIQYFSQNSNINSRKENSNFEHKFNVSVE